jgi:hypothetical protein
MSVHRFRELWNTPEPTPAASVVGSMAAFVPCPSPVTFGMSAVHLAQVEYLYRIAFEQAQAQVAARARPSRWPAFSLN